MISGADRFVDELERADVRVVFGLPGVHNMEAWEALGRSERVRRIGVRHEQTAAYAADGYHRATGEVGVALVTTGPGAANTLGATGEARASGSAIVVVATDIPTTLRRAGMVGGTLHEAPDQCALFETLTKAAIRAEDAGQIADAIRRAKLAPGRPVFLEVPTDLFAQEAAEVWDVGEFRAEVLPPQPDVSDAIAQLAGTTRPLIWAGSGALGASEEVGRLARTLGAPVLTSFGARGLLGREHPLEVGLPVHVPDVGALWEQADVVLVLGSDLDGPNTLNWRLPQPARVIAVNCDRTDALKNYAPDAAVFAEVRPVCDELVRLLPDGEAPCWIDVANLRKRVRGQMRADSPRELAFVEAFSRAVEPHPNLHVVCDMCVAGYWLGAAFHPPGPRRFQYPIGWGTLGYGFPAALGAAAAEPALAVCGDGGFLFACGELATVAQERMPLTILLVDDAAYGMLGYEQEQRGIERDGVDLVGPDFAALAAAFGIKAQSVDGLADDFERALAAQLADPEPSMLVARAALQPPLTTSPRWHRQGPPAWAR